jgi:poly(beta-D-mannuronate) lyase
MPVSRHSFTLIFCFAVLGFQKLAFPAVYNVDSLDVFQQRINDANPGDIITLKDGTYTLERSVDIACAGTKEQLITIQAQTVGGVNFIGPQGVSVKKGAAYVVLSGFNFLHETGKTTIAVGASHIRITRCTFCCPGRGPYLTISGDDIEIDYNEFRDKSRFGNMISITGANGQVARRVWIHHNYFRDFNKSTVQGETNDLEVIRFGLSGLSMSTGNGIVEHNLFVRCVGENELISNKSCGNIYRYNTFLDSRGSEMSLRHGNDCEVYHNYFRGTAGIRIFGDRHKVYENYLENNSIGIHIGNGGAEVADGAALTSHDRPDDCVIRKNVLINNNRQFYMTGRRNGLGAPRTTFAENIIVGGDVAASIGGPIPGAVWKDNVVWQTKELGDMPESGVKRTDPGQLSLTMFNLKILTSDDVGPAAKKNC